MSYPLSSEVVPGDATEAAQYNNLRSDALFLGGADGASGTVRDLLYSAVGNLPLSAAGSNTILITASNIAPAALMIGGTVYAVTSNVSLSLSSVDLPNPGRYTVYAAAASGGTFTLSLLSSGSCRAVGSFLWDGVGIIPGTVHSLKELEIIQASRQPAAAAGRLTLVSGDPCPEMDISQASTLYFVPYHGNEIGLYLWGSWEYFTFSGLSLGTSGLVREMPYDIFLGVSSEGLELTAVSWGTASARPAGTLQYIDGVRVSGSDSSKRYLGTIALNAGGSFEDSRTGRLIWNENNQISRPIFSKLLTTKSQGTGHMNCWAPYYDEDAPQVRLLVPTSDCEFKLTGIGLSSPISESDRGYQRAAAVGIIRDAMMVSPYTGNKPCSLAGTHGFGNGPMNTETENNSAEFIGLHSYTLGFWTNYTFYPAGTNLADVTGLYPGLFGKINA